MELMSKAVQQLSDSNLRIKLLFRWKFSAELSFAIFWLENFLHNGLGIFWILGCTSHWTEKTGGSVQGSLLLSLVGCLPSVSPAKWVFDKAPPHPRKWVNSITWETDEENGTHQGGIFGVVVSIWVAIWKLFMLAVQNKLLIINIGMETGFVFGPSPEYKVFRSTWRCKKCAFIKVFFKILTQTVCWA